MQPEEFCFCELAALQAMGALDDSEQSLVEAYIAEFPEFASELANFEEAVAAIAYSAPPVPMAADLKGRLFERISTEIPEQKRNLAVPPPIAPSPKTLTVRAADVIWQPHFVPGVTIGQLHVDTVRRELVCLVRAAAGVYYPRHRHAGVEEIFMLEGDLVIDGETYGGGDYIRSEPNSMHAPETRTGCMFFIRTSVDDEILS